MTAGFKYCCYPDKTQAETMLRWIGCQRVIYNAKVQEDRYFRTFQRKFAAFAGVQILPDQKYSQLIGEEAPWLRDVPSQVLRNGAFRFKTAYERFFRKLSGRPKLKKKAGKASVLLTRELFRITFPDGSGWAFLDIGTGKFPVGRIPVRIHRTKNHPKPPASIVLSVECGRWSVAFSNETLEVSLAPEDIGSLLERLPEDELREITLGIDRNTPAGKQFAMSDGSCTGFSPAQLVRIEKKRKAIKRWQRKLSRRKPCSTGSKKAKKRIGKINASIRHVREDVAHKASRGMADNPKFRLFVFEKLNINGMTKRPKVKRDKNGRWLPNGAKAKAGLNQAILMSAWGLLLTFVRYKALREGKLTVTVPPFGTSQECPVCGHSHKDNRQTQAGFVCIRCRHAGNADINAALNIRERGVEKVRSGAWREEFKKRGRAGTARTGGLAPDAGGDTGKTGMAVPFPLRSWNPETAAAASVQRG